MVGARRGFSVVGLRMRGVEVGGLKKAVKAFLGFSSTLLDCDLDFFPFLDFCLCGFVGGTVVSSSPNLGTGD